MSTRATYKFKNTGTTVYLHHDGYPEGAASYINKAMEFTDNNYISTEAFLRANRRASITGHDSHGDCEYHYIFDGDNIEALKVHDDRDNMTSFFTGTIYEFMNKYCGNRFSEWYQIPSPYLNNNAIHVNEVKHRALLMSELNKFRELASFVSDIENVNFKSTHERIKALIKSYEKVNGVVDHMASHLGIYDSPYS